MVMRIVSSDIFDAQTGVTFASRMGDTYDAHDFSQAPIFPASRATGAVEAAE
jgi:hypothetical protein